MFELSEEQKNAIEHIEKIWDKQPITVLTGYAGSGKSSTINSLIFKMGLKKTEVAYCAYTGCAALVLKKKGINAQTIHHLIYNVKKDKNGKLYSILKQNLDKNYKLIVIDEGSFVNEKLIQDLLSFRIPIIMLGDEGQLQPPGGKMNKYMLEPDVRLTQIFRQKENNSILDFSFNIRQGIFDFNFNDNNVKCFNYVNIDMLEWADQILCCTNKDKDEINQLIRKSKGFKSNLPEVGDKLMCLKNNWNKFPITGEEYELVNGMTGYVERIIDATFSPFWNTMKIEFSLEFDRSIRYVVTMDVNPFLGKAPIKTEYHLDSFDFGYACTIHKSQASQWEKVLVYAKHSFGDKKKLFYTAATRAEKKLVWIS